MAGPSLSVSRFSFIVLGLTIVPDGIAAAGDWQIIPTIEISETYTDNVELAPAGAERSDWVTEIQGGLLISGTGARASVRLDYTPSEFIFARSDEANFRHNLLGTGNVELIEDHFFVDASASIRETFLSLDRQISFSDRNLTQNRRQVQVYSISPRWEHRFGSSVDASLQYRYQFSEVDRPFLASATNNLSDSSQHSVSLVIASGTNFQRLRWSVTGFHRKENRERNAAGFKNSVANLNLSYNFNRAIAVIGSIGYEQFSAVNFARDRDGLVWDAGLLLTPSRRTQLRATYGERTDNKRFDVSGTYQVSSRTSLSLSYNESFQTSQALLGQDLDSLLNLPITLPDGTLITDPIDPSQFGGLDGLPDLSLTNDVFRQDRFSLQFSHQKRRTRLSVTGFFEERKFQSRPQEEGFGATIRITRTFSRKMDGSVQGSYTNREFDISGQDDDIYLASANIDYELQANVSAFLTYTFTKRDSNLVTAELEENAITVGFRARF